MLREIANVHHNEPGVYRRWFTDEYFDLTVWTDAGRKPIGFQLCYDLDGKERALTLLRGAYRHTKIDGGEDTATMHRTPILVADGAFDTDGILRRFLAESAEIDAAITDYVAKGIRDYEVRGSPRTGS